MAERRPEEEFEGEYVQDVALRPHLVRTLQSLNDDGTLNPVVIVTTEGPIPPSPVLNQTSQYSGSEDAGPSAIHARQKQINDGTPSPEAEGTFSSTKARYDSTDTMRSSDDQAVYVWDYGNKSGQFSPTPHQLGSPQQIRSRSKARSEYSDHHRGHECTPNRPSPTTLTSRRTVLLAVLVLLASISLLFAAHTTMLAWRNDATLRATRFRLLVSTQVVSVCAGLCAIIVRRSPAEAAVYFMAITLLGNIVRWEVECLF